MMLSCGAVRGSEVAERALSLRSVASYIALQEHDFYM